MGYGSTYLLYQLMQHLLEFVLYFFFNRRGFEDYSQGQVRFFLDVYLYINKIHTNKNIHKHHTSLKCDDWASFVSPLIPFPRKENITKCNLNLDKKSSSNNQGFGLKMTYTKPCESLNVCIALQGSNSTSRAEGPASRSSNGRWNDQPILDSSLASIAYMVLDL